VATEKNRGDALVIPKNGGFEGLDLRINPKSLQHEIVEKLRSAILAGLFKPGDRLVEATLCASLGVSRPSLREALRSLEAEKLIVMVPNRGPQIPVLSWEDAQHIYHVREILEGEAAALCASLITQAETQELAGALDAFRDAVAMDDAAFRIAATDRFYDIVIRCSANPIIGEIIERLRARINFLRGRSMSQPGRTKHSLEEMEAIFQAIQSKRPDAARAAARLHIANARQASKGSFPRLPGPRKS
jgi:DNA-binding GntR family transcriptional regulator